MDNKRRKLLGTTYLTNSSKSARGEFHPHHLAKGIREEAFALDVGQPRPTCLFFRERNVVPILLCLAVEQAKLRPLERLAQRGREGRKRGEHGRPPTGFAWLAVVQGRCCQSAVEPGRSDGAGQRRAKRGRSEPGNTHDGSQVRNFYHTISPGDQFICRTVPLWPALSSQNPFRSFPTGSPPCGSPKKKKGLPRLAPLFLRNLFLMLLYLHASDGVGMGACASSGQKPRCVQLMPQIRVIHALRASRSMNRTRPFQDLDLCRAPSMLRLP